MRNGRTQQAQDPEARSFRLRRRARWALPAGAVVAVAAVVAGTTVAGAQAAPSLPGRSAAALLADVQRSPGPGPMTATIQLTASLGLPDLPGAGDSSAALSPLSLLSGTHSANLWYADPQHVRIAEPVRLGESDLRRDGRQVWLWNSRDQTATHIVLPAAANHAVPRVPATPRPGGTMPTPQQVARQILAAVGPSTTVSVQRNVEVAGQAAYQIALAPRASGSLIGRVTIAIDAARSFPLRVQVFARGSASPAFQLGFTSLSFGRPAASNFSFTPPAGAKVKTVRPPVPARPGMLPGMPRSKSGFLGFAPGKRLVFAGKQGKVVVVDPATGRRVTMRLPHGRHLVLPASDLPGKVVTGKARHGEQTVILRSGKAAAVIPARGPQRNSDWQLKPARRAPSGSLFTKPFAAFAGAAGPGIGGPGAFPGRPQILGKDWLSVLVIRPMAAPATTAAPPSGQPAGGSVSSAEVISPDSTISSTSGPTGPAMPGIAGPGTPPILRALLQATTPVHGAWGSGRLLRTSLVSVLITSKGTVLAGAVTPAVLYADAARVK
ncbi:MAG TPA: hypothetical protein VFV41_13035 [Streptosporangiaceae bacterium]|nr:hypothetical protein [Streptosporangiaceae bacterium]